MAAEMLMLQIDVRQFLVLWQQALGCQKLLPHLM